MYAFEIEATIAARPVNLLGHTALDGAIVIEHVVDYTGSLDGVPMPAAERDAFVAEHRVAIEDEVRAHAQAEDERRCEERDSGPRVRY